MIVSLFSFTFVNPTVVLYVWRDFWFSWVGNLIFHKFVNSDYVGLTLLMREMYFWYRNDLLRDLLTLFFFYFRLSTKSCLVLFFWPRNGWGKEVTHSCYSKTVFLCFVLMKKTKQDRKTANQFLSSWPPSRRKPPHVEGDAERRRVERDSTELVNMHHMRNDFVFFFLSSPSCLFIVCLKQFKFQNARCFCCCCWFPVDVPPFFVVTFFFKCYTFSLLCSCCVHLILYLRCPPRLHYYYYCSVCVCECAVPPSTNDFLRLGF